MRQRTSQEDKVEFRQPYLLPAGHSRTHLGWKEKAAQARRGLRPQGVSTLTATLGFVKPQNKATGSPCDPRGANKQAGSCSRSPQHSSENVIPGGSTLGPDPSSWLSNSQSYLPSSPCQCWVRGPKKILQAPASFRAFWR